MCFDLVESQGRGRVLKSRQSGAMSMAFFFIGFSGALLWLLWIGWLSLFILSGHWR